MRSDVDVYKAVADRFIEELKNLKKRRIDLESNLKSLNSRRDDVMTKTSTELRPGRKIRHEVKNWFNEVEQIEDEVKKNKERIKLSCAPENIARIVVASSSETLSSNQNDARNVSIVGVGGSGNTSIHNENSTITVNHSTHNHCCHEREADK